jgi:hypothetical protein
MSDTLIRIAEHLVDRTTGPMHFRVYLQPTMALLFATLDGIKDAKKGNPPYFWSLLTHSESRSIMLKDGWKSIWKVFTLALALDGVYQYKVQSFIYPGELILVALVLAIMPYLIARGLVTRMLPKPKD